MAFDDEEKNKIYSEFDEVVNMAPAKLEKWLESEDSKAVGYKDDGEGESTGHASGRKIIDIRHKNKADLTEADYEHMRKVHSYVARHKAQGPSKEKVEDSKWRYSLMNWGHDPLE